MKILNLTEALIPLKDIDKASKSVIMKIKSLLTFNKMPHEGTLNHRLYDICNEITATGYKNVIIDCPNFLVEHLNNDLKARGISLYFPVFINDQCVGIFPAHIELDLLKLHNVRKLWRILNEEIE